MIKKISTIRIFLFNGFLFNIGEPLQQPEKSAKVNQASLTKNE